MTSGEPKLRGDLVISRQDGVVVVKDPIAGRFFRFREVDHFVASQLDGATSLGEICERTRQKVGATPTPEVVEGFVATLGRLGLLETVAAGQEASVPESRRLRGDLFHLRLHAFDPDPLLERLVGKVRLCFTPYFVAVSSLVILASLAILIGHRADLARDLTRLYRVHTVLLVWLAIFGVAAAHEFAHSLMCKHFGGQVREMGVLLIYFQLAFYCNVSDAWLLPEKSKRLWVTLAGPYVELVLWAIAVLTWRFTGADTWLSAMALVVVVTSGVRLVFNLNPLIRLDGYYLLSDALSLPNLRARAFSYVSARLARLRRSQGPTLLEASPRERRIYLAYGLLAGGYSAWLLGGIVWALTRLFTERSQGAGAVLSAGLLVALFHGRLKQWLPRPALLQLLVALGLVLVALFLGRTELTVAGEFTVTPRHDAAVRAGARGLEALTAEVTVPENGIGDVQVGQPVVLHARALPETSFVGRVTAIVPTAAKEGEAGRGKVVRVTTVVDNAERVLEPAMTGDAKIYCGERRIVDLLTRRFAGSLPAKGGSWW